MARRTTDGGTRAPEGAEGFARQVAANLRRLRRERDWTLAEVSARAGVSRAMLSQVETGKTTPTIAVLWKVATGFGVPFAELLREEARGGMEVRRGAELRSIASPDRKFRSTPLVPASLGPGIELYRITIDKGGAHDSPPHAPGTVEVVAVESGRLRLRVGGETETLGAGDVATFAADVEHGYAAEGGACVLYDLIRYAAAGQPNVRRRRSARRKAE